MECGGSSSRDHDKSSRTIKHACLGSPPADSFARAVAFATSQPENVDVNEILFRPTRQEL
jgi:NADP-dependent 3-hydroxy acid dehydrogenase YdfG